MRIATAVLSTALLVGLASAGEPCSGPNDITKVISVKVSTLVKT